jgi:hypothetical protein
MRNWLARVNGEPLPWLLERDCNNPEVRYFALLSLLDRPADAPEVQEARRTLMSSGPVPAILAAQQPEGYWVRPGWGYGPKYRGTVWSLIMLAQLGADGRDPRVARAAEYVLENATSPTGAFSCLENRSTAGAVPCLNGNLLAALLDLGWAEDTRLQCALEWLARVITGEGVAPSSERDAPLHYYRSGSCAPGFCCAANGRKPCAWGAVKVMAALGKLPLEARTGLVHKTIGMGVDFLFSCDPATAAYPTREDTKPSSSWFRFGFPLFYVSDVLQILEVLAGLGHGSDPRLSDALNLVLDKQDELGRWSMDYSYNGKTWVDVEEKRKPSKWVTLRALRVLRAASA